MVDTGATGTKTALSATAQNNTTKAVSTNSTTGISDIFYKDGVQTGKVAVDVNGAALYGANTATYVKANQNGTVAINGSNVIVGTNGSMTLKNGTTQLLNVSNTGNLNVKGSITAGGTTIANNGAITANNGLTSSKTYNTNTGTGYDSAAFQAAIDGYSGHDGTQIVYDSVSTTKYTNADSINSVGVNAGSNSGYNSANNGSVSSSTGKVTSDQNGLMVSSNKTTKSFTQTEAIAKTGTATGGLASGTNSYGGTKDKLTVYNSAGETTTYTVKDTQTTITNSFKSTADDGLNYSKSNDTYQKLYVRKVDKSGNETGETTTEFSKIDQDNTMSQNNGSFSIVGSSQKDIASSSENMLDGRMSNGTKATNTLSANNGLASLNTVKEYYTYNDGNASAPGYKKQNTKTTVQGGLSINNSTGTSAEDAKGSITLSNSKVNYEYQYSNELVDDSDSDFGKKLVTTTTAKTEYSTNATLGQGEYSVTANKYDKNTGKAASAGAAYVNNATYGTRLTQSNYNDAGALQSTGTVYVNNSSVGTNLTQTGYADGTSASLSLNKGAAAVYGSKTVSVKSGSYGLTVDEVNKTASLTSHGTLTFSGTNLSVGADGSMSLKNPVAGTSSIFSVSNTGTATASNGVIANAITADTTYKKALDATAKNANVTARSLVDTTSGVYNSYTNGTGTYSVTTNGSGTTFRAPDNTTTTIKGNTITTGTINANKFVSGNVTISNNNVSVGTSANKVVLSDGKVQVGESSLTGDTLTVKNIKLGGTITDNAGNPVGGNDLSMGANGSITATAVDSIGTKKNTFVNNSDNAYMIHYTGDGSGTYTQSGKVDVTASGATMYGADTNTYVRAGQNGNIDVKANGGNGIFTVTSKNFTVSSSGKVTAKGGSDVKVTTTDRQYSSVVDTANGVKNSALVYDATNDKYVEVAKVQVTTSGVNESHVKDGISHTVTTNTSGTAFTGSDNGTNLGTTTINGSKITTGNVVAGTVTTGSASMTNGKITVGTRTTITDGKITLGTGTTLGDGTITTKTLNVDTINLGNKIIDNNGNTIGSDLTLGANGSINATAVDAAETKKTVLNNNADSSYMIHYEKNTAGNYAQSGRVDVTASGASMYGNNGSTYVKANQDGTVTANGTNFSISQAGKVTAKGGSDITATDTTTGTKAQATVTTSGINDIYTKKDAAGNTLATASSSVNGSGITESLISKDAAGITTSSASSTITSTGIKDTYIDYENGTTHTVTTGTNGTVFGASGNGSGTTTINGNTITTGTLNVDNIVLGNKIIDKNTGTIGGDLVISADGSASFAEGKVKIDSVGNFSAADGNFKVDSKGNVTNRVEIGTNKVTNTTRYNENKNIVTNGITTNTHSQTATRTADTIAYGTYTSTSSQTAKTISNTISGGAYNVGQTMNGEAGTITNTAGTTTTTLSKDGGLVVSSVDANNVRKNVIINDGDVGIRDKNNNSINLSDLGYLGDLDDEIAASEQYINDKTAVGAINAEAQIRRDEVARLDNRIDKVDAKIDKVGAMAAAIANLRTMGYDPTAPTEIAVGIGQYRDKTGAALGFFHYPNKNFMISLSVSTSGEEVMGGIGATWKFGHRDPAKVAQKEAEKAEKAKLAKAEAMKQAAKAARVKAQQEKHAKMLAAK
ncbi:MAG: YadA-like family protein [Phascolarctobacterium sp.]|nr:YadA-like family protein [Phascolarctobacterium sp.]